MHGCAHSRLAETAALKIAAEASSAIQDLGETAEPAEVTVVKAPNSGGMIVVQPPLRSLVDCQQCFKGHDDIVHRFNHRLIWPARTSMRLTTVQYQGPGVSIGCSSAAIDDDQHQRLALHDHPLKHVLTSQTCHRRRSVVPTELSKSASRRLLLIVVGLSLLQDLDNSGNYQGTGLASDLLIGR